MFKKSKSPLNLTQNAKSPLIYITKEEHRGVLFTFVKKSLFVIKLYGQSWVKTLNADIDGFFKGLYMTSGLFQVWYSHGIMTYVCDY